MSVIAAAKKKPGLPRPGQICRIGQTGPACPQIIVNLKQLPIYDQLEPYLRSVPLTAFRSAAFAAVIFGAFR